MPKVNRKPPAEKAGEREVQVVRLPADWSKSKVVKWLKDHDFITKGLLAPDEAEEGQEEPAEPREFWHARQYDPEHFRKGSYLTFSVPTSGGVQYVRGVVKDSVRRITESMRIDGQWTERESDGSLVVEAPIFRVGINSYEKPDGGFSREYKSAAVIFDKHTIESCDGMPITMGHPPDRFVDSDNWRDYARGHVSAPFRKDKKGGVLYGMLRVSDGDLIRMIREGRICETSPGFYAELDSSPGQAANGKQYDSSQVELWANHLATGPEGWARGGREMSLRLDGHGDVILGAEQASEKHNEEAEVPEKRTIVFDGKAYELTDVSGGFEDALERFKAEQAEMVAQRDEALGKLAAAEGERDELRSRLDAVTSPAEIAKAAQARATLIEQARIVSGNQQFTSDGDELAVMTEALKAGGNDTSVVDGRDEGFRRGYITATFHRIAQANASEQKAITDAWSPDQNQKSPKANLPPSGGMNDEWQPCADAQDMILAYDGGVS